MNPIQKQLTAEQITSKREKAQKKHARHRRAAEQERSKVLATTSSLIAPLQRISINQSTQTTSHISPSKPSCNPDETADSFAQPPRDNEVECQNAGWPWVGVPRKLLTQAPYAVSEYNGGFFRSPEVIQTSPLLNIHNGMQHPILFILFQYHSCASKFAATCQAAFHMVAAYIDHWDVTRGHFNNCDKDLKGMSGVNTASVGRIVVVTPFRVRQWRGENYKCELFGLQNMTHAFANFADRFEILQLHRIPLLSTHLLALVVPAMRRLKVLGIYRCELIHFGDTMKLLEIIRKNRGSGMTQNIALDFYPRFHVGPDEIEGWKYRTGSYGVTWDNFGLDSRLAIWQQLTKILPQAKSQGVDLIGKDAAFKLWLDRSPCWRVDDTITAILEGWEDIVLAVQFDYPNTRGRRSRLSYGGEWCSKRYLCRRCQDNVLGIFYDFDEYSLHAWPSTAGYTPLCLGCKLTMHLNYETDHAKIAKMDMIKWWLDNNDGTINEDDISKALHKRSKIRGMKAAEFYDRERRKLAARNLGPGRQLPLRRGYPYSPQIYDREPTGYW